MLNVVSQVDGSKNLAEAKPTDSSSRYIEDSSSIERINNGVDWNVGSVVCGDNSSDLCDGVFYG